MEKKLAEINVVIEKLLEYLKLHNDGSVKYQINALETAVKIIESEESYESKINLLSDIQKNIYPPRGGLSDFYVWRENEDERIAINKPISELGDMLWRLLN